MNALERLPARMERVESQLLQLRDEVHEGFSAVRSELHDCREGLQYQIRAVDDRLTAELRAQREQMQSLGERLSAEIREGREESRRHMQVVVEHFEEKLRVVDEGGPAKRRKKPRA